MSADKCQLNLDAKTASLLYYALSNAESNIGARDKWDKTDKAALELCRKLKDTLSKVKP